MKGLGKYLNTRHDDPRNLNARMLIRRYLIHSLLVRIPETTLLQEEISFLASIYKPIFGLYVEIKLTSD